MKRIKLIINPASGRQSMEKKIDNLCKYLLDDGYILGKFFTEKKYDAMFAAKEACSGDFDLIVACGGDGTVNEVVKGIMTSEKKLPLAILAGGTVNDFANYLEMPKTAVGFYKLIKRNEQVDVDIGKVNDGYFVNVVAGGLLTKIAYQATSDMKAVLGRLAYYLEALKEIASEGLDPVNVKIVSEEFVSEEKILLFVVSNSSSIGGFKKLAPEASILDGLLDVVLIKNADLAELANIFVNVLTGEHIRHPKVTYYKTRELTINSQNNIFIDIDGEFGGELPVHFKVMPKSLKILV